MEPVDNKNYSNKISDEPLAVDLVDGETKANQVTDVPVMDIPEVQLEEDNGRKLDGDQFSRNDVSSAGDIADSSLVCNKDHHSTTSHLPLDRTITSHSRKKLLVLDVNGLLADFVDHVPFGYEPDANISKKSGEISCFLVSFDLTCI